MTVQELINYLQTVEDKSAIVVTADYENSWYNKVTIPIFTDIAESMRIFDDDDYEFNNHINAVIL